MIDFHCHVDLYEHPQRVLDEAAAKQCLLLAVTTTPVAWEGNCSLVAGRRHVRVAAGLHPELVVSRHSEVDLLCSLVPTTHYVGEIGLDGSGDNKHSLRLQQDVLRQILRSCELAGGRVMTLHSRQATSLLLDEIERHPGAGVPVLHWFTGNMDELRRAVELDCWFSVGPAMLRSRKGRALASAMPVERLLTETDGPLASCEGRPLVPWDVEDAEDRLGELLGMPSGEVRQQVRENLGRLGHAVEEMWN